MEVKEKENLNLTNEEKNLVVTNEYENKAKSDVLIIFGIFTLIFIGFILVFSFGSVRHVCWYLNFSFLVIEFFVKIC